MWLLVGVSVTNAALRQICTVLGDAEAVAVPAGAGVSDLNTVLDGRDGRRLAMMGGDGDLNRVVERLMRRKELASTPVAIVPIGPDSVVGRALGLPGESAAAARVAATGQPQGYGLIRDDHGGVVLAAAELRPWEGDMFGMRAYVEDSELVNRTIRTFTVRGGTGRLRASAVAGRLGLGLGLRRVRHAEGRAVTVSCEPARLVVDGETRPRPQRRRTWWYEPDLLQLVR